MRAIGETSSSSAMASSSEGVVSAHSPAESVFYAHMASGALAGAAEHTAMFPAVRDALLACEEALRPGNTMGQVFDAHARGLDAAGYGEHRLNACGYALGPRFSPSWMEDQMFYEDAPTVIESGMVFFLHMILMDSDTQTAMCLGRTSLVTDAGAEALSRLPMEMSVRD